MSRPTNQSLQTTSALYTLADRLALISGWALLGLATFVVLNIILRGFFNIVLDGTVEIGGFVLVITTSVGFGYALLDKAHVRVDVVVVRLPPRTQAVSNLISLVCMTCYAGMFLWQAFSVFLVSMRNDSHTAASLQTPLVIPQGLWVLGLALFLVAAMDQLVRCGTLFWNREYEALVRRFGLAGERDDGIPEGARGEKDIRDI